MSSGLPLLDLQQLCADHLDEDRWFDQIPVITENLGDVATLVNIAVGKLGSCCVVETPLANATKPNIPSIWFDEIPIIVTVWESVILNRSDTGSNKKALDTAQIIASLLHQFVPTGFATVVCRTPTIIRADDPELLGYHVMFTTEIGFKYQPEPSLSNETSIDLLTEAGAILTTET